jgi:hypothetical protein
MKEYAKILGVILAAWVTFLLTAPEAKADHIPVPTQSQYSQQANTAFKRAEECGALFFKSKAIRTGGRYEGAPISGEFKSDSYDDLADTGEYQEKHIQECAVYRTKPYFKILNKWGDHYPGVVSVLHQQWLRDNQPN